MEKTSILIASRCVDDRSAIASLLEEQDDFLITGMVDDSFGLVHSAINLQPDVLVMDFFLEDIDTLKLAPVVKRNSPATALIVLCSLDEHIAVDRVLRAGVTGYLLRQDFFGDLASAVRSVSSGGLYVSGMVRDQVLKYFSLYSIIAHETGKSPPDTSIAHRTFTLTELQIFRGIIRGDSDQEIARNLNITIGTVRNYICQAKKKVGLQNRTQIIMYVLSNGLIDWESGSLGRPKKGS